MLSEAHIFFILTPPQCPSFSLLGSTDFQWKFSVKFGTKIGIGRIWVGFEKWEETWWSWRSSLLDSMFPISVLTAHMYCPHKNKKQIKRNNFTCFFLNVFMYSAGSRVELSVSVMCKKKKKGDNNNADCVKSTNKVLWWIGLSLFKYSKVIHYDSVYFGWAFRVSLVHCFVEGECIHAIKSG